MLFQEVQNQEKEYLMSTYNRFPVALASGSGAKAVDTEGKEYIVQDGDIILFRFNV